MAHSAKVVLIILCISLTHIARSQANSAAFQCKIEFFFNKKSTVMLTVMFSNGKKYNLQEQEVKQFQQYDHLRSQSLFYVIGTVSGQEDLLPDHKIATGRALEAQAWLEKRGIIPESIFTYAVVPSFQTPYGQGNAEAYFCNKQCPCRDGYDQRTRVLDADEFAPQYPVTPSRHYSSGWSPNCYSVIITQLEAVAS